MKLVQPVIGNGHNITMDNFLTSLSLAQKLAKQKISMVGTIRRNRKEMPRLENTSFQHTAAFIEDESCSFLCIPVQKNKNVSILSMYHRHVTIPDGENPKRKPNTVLSYNETKVGVDVLDQMLKLYSRKPGSRRWPVQHVFSNILDMALLNAWILFKMITKRPLSRREFIRAVVDGLG